MLKVGDIVRMLAGDYANETGIIVSMRGGCRNKKFMVQWFNLNGVRSQELCTAQNLQLLPADQPFDRGLPAPLVEHQAVAHEPEVEEEMVDRAHLSSDDSVGDMADDEYVAYFTIFIFSRYLYL